MNIKAILDWDDAETFSEEVTIISFVGCGNSIKAVYLNKDGKLLSADISNFKIV